MKEDMKRGEAQGEQAGLPSWLFPTGFGIGLAALIVGVIWPPFAHWAVYWLMLVPVLAALAVVIGNWRRDRRLGVAALLALLGVGLVLVGRELLK